MCPTIPHSLDTPALGPAMMIITKKTQVGTVTLTEWSVVNMIMFIEEFPNFLENTLQFQDELYIFGDFNIHLDKPSVNTRSFLDILDTFSLHQHVTFPTHIYGHWLDVFITRSNCKHVKAISSSDGLSDHLTVLIDLWLQIKSSPEKANITFRPINKIDLDTLHMDLSNSDLLIWN